ncbi:MAG TPA: amino acid permease, partial [Steroidobacteraceae bacterium]|nr:amino acid permease [Steroidobacteraceae bacterium]
MHRLFSTKPIGELHEADTGNELRRTLDARALVLLGIGAIIGTGIFVLTGTAAANHAGPALVVSFMIAGLGCALAGLCYAEFASMIPVSGSAYSYSYATLGELVAWFIGWNLILEYLFAAATVAVGWSGYVVSLVEQLGMHLPDALTHAPFTKGAGHFEIVRTGAILNLPAVLIIAAITALCYVGIHQSARFNAIVVAIKVAVIILFVGFGFWAIDGANWQPFIPENTGRFGQFGWSGVVQAAGIIFFAYIGFDAVSTAAQEAKNPQRDMPIGIMGSLVVCTILYVAVSAVLTGMVHYSELNSPAPIAVALDRHPELAWLAGWIKLGAIAGMTSV